MVGTVDFLLEPRPPALAVQCVSCCMTHTVPHLIMTGTSRKEKKKNKKRFVADFDDHVLQFRRPWTSRASLLKALIILHTPDSLVCVK